MTGNLTTKPPDDDLPDDWRSRALVLEGRLATERGWTAALRGDLGRTISRLDGVEMALRFQGRKDDTDLEGPIRDLHEQVASLLALLREAADWRRNSAEGVALPHTSACVGGVADNLTGENRCMRCRIVAAAGEFGKET